MRAANSFLPCWNTQKKIRARLVEAVGSIDNDRLQQRFTPSLSKIRASTKRVQPPTHHIAEVPYRYRTQKAAAANSWVSDAGIKPRSPTLWAANHRYQCTQASVRLKSDRTDARTSAEYRIIGFPDKQVSESPFGQHFQFGNLCGIKA